MNPTERQKFNTLFGSVLLTLGLVAWGASGYFVVAPNTAAVAAPTASAVDIPSCQRALTEMGYTVNEKGAELQLYEPLGSAPREQLEKASVAATLCRLPMNSFCMGEGCERSGVNLSLQLPNAAADKGTGDKSGAEKNTGKPPKAAAVPTSKPSTKP